MAIPLYDQLLTKAGGRSLGAPVARPNSGGRSMQPSIPSYPAPPSTTVGETGRPSSRPVVPVGVTPPSPPTAPVSPVGPTSPGTPPNSPRGPFRGPNAPTSDRPENHPVGGPDVFPETPAQAPQMRYGPAGGAPTAAMNGAVAQPATQPTAPTLNLNRMPARRDYVGLLPGTGIGTPYGPATVGSDGHPVIQFPTPEHEARYRNDETQYRGRYGPTPLSQFPGAPQPIVQLGRPAYNPFSSTWLVPNQQ